MHAIKYKTLSEVKKYPRNPRKHDFEVLRKSMDRFGFVTPVVCDENTGVLVAGHGRLETLIMLHDEGRSPPRGIKVTKSGEWQVPTLTGVSFANEDEFKAYLLADNRTTETAAWDGAMLAELLKELQENSTAKHLGWSEAEIEGIIASNQKVIEKVTQEIEDEDDSDDLLSDLRGSNEIREVVLHLGADEYDEFVTRLQKVMAKRRLPGYVEAVNELLDLWEAQDDA